MGRKVILTENQMLALWFYSGLPLPEGYVINQDILPRAAKALQSKGLIEASAQFPYFRANREGLALLPGSKP